MDMLEYVIKGLQKRNMLVMLDQHVLHEKYYISELWYEADYPEEMSCKGWKILLDKFGQEWNVFALDLQNEPHYKATWGSGNNATDWNRAAERIIRVTTIIIIK